MENSGLIKVIRTFSKEEMKEFEKLVASPFFSTGRNLTPLLNVIKKYHPDFENENLIKEKVFEKLYPGKIYSETVIRKLATELYHLSIEYIKQISLRQNPLLVNTCSGYNFIDRNLDSVALKLINEVDFDIEKGKIDYDFFVSKPKINNVKNYYYYNKRSLNYYKEIMFLRTQTFYNVIESFILDFCLAYPDFILNRKRYESENLNLNFLVIADCIDFEKYVQTINPDSKSKDEISTLLCLYSLIFYKNPGKYEYFEKFKDLFFRNFEMFSDDLLTEFLEIFKRLIMFAENHLPGNISIQMKFELFNFILKKNLFIDPILKVFPKNYFKETFLSGFRLEKFEWAEKFLNDYSKFLKDEEREYTVNLCRSYLYFAKGKYDDCINFLNLINIDHPTEKAANYYLRAAALYELKYYDESESVLNAYLKFLERNTVAFNRDKTQFINFISCLKHLIHFNFTKNKSHLFGMNELLKDETKTVTMKKWLINKLNEAENLK